MLPCPTMSNQYYLTTDQITLESFDEKTITQKFNEGYVFSRIGRGIMVQTRSLRINLNEFALSSENRRILRKTVDLTMNVVKLPYENYHWSIHKMAKDFYTKQGGEGTFSASKVKELFTQPEENNFNIVFAYSINNNTIGYCVSYSNNDLVQYSYPFYDLEISKENKNIGMGMMIRAIEWAQKERKQFVYLGSVVTQQSLYKLQFNGVEWWDEDQAGWNKNLGELKTKIKTR